MLQSPYALENSDCLSWKIKRGKTLSRIRCSKFCSNELLRQYSELLDGRETCAKTPVTANGNEECKTDESRESLNSNMCKSSQDMKNCSQTCTKGAESEGLENPSEEARTELYVQIWRELVEFRGSITLVNETPNITCQMQQDISKKIEHQEKTLQAADENGSDKKNLLFNGWILGAAGQNDKHNRTLFSNFYSTFKVCAIS